MADDAATSSAARIRRARPIVAVTALALLLGAVALPTLAADPSSPPNEQAKPGNPNKGPKDRAAKVPKEAITLNGTISTAQDEDGETEYRIRSGGTTYTLDAGPSWFFGDDHPLAGRVGDGVTIVGEVAEGSTDVDVVSIDGTALREGGKPPWAGGWKRVGKDHPGWSEEKAARMAEKEQRKKDRFGGCFPPGQCKQDEAAE